VALETRRRRASESVGFRPLAKMGAIFGGTMRSADRCRVAPVEI